MRRMNPLRLYAMAGCLALFCATGCENLRREVVLSEKVPEIDKTRNPELFTVFFGLDNALPLRSRLLYKKAPGKDGMPVVFSLEIDPTTLDAADFAVTAKDGTVFPVEAVTLSPADEAFELRTVLLIGNYGDHPGNPPVTVEIVGDLLSRTGQNFKGVRKSVIPLEEGPILSYAEHFTFTDDYPYKADGNGCDCPRDKTTQVVKAVWAGGVRGKDGNELGETALDSFTVALVQGSDTLLVHPFQLADLADNDNNIDLCLKESGTPVYLHVTANTAIDPRDDLNPATEVAIRSRW